jgi:hypothetical protein
MERVPGAAEKEAWSDSCLHTESSHCFNPSRVFFLACHFSVAYYLSSRPNPWYTLFFLLLSSIPAGRRDIIPAADLRCCFPTVWYAPARYERFHSILDPFQYCTDA